MIAPCGMPPQAKARKSSSQGHLANQLKAVLEKCLYVVRFFSQFRARATKAWDLPQVMPVAMQPLQLRVRVSIE